MSNNAKVRKHWAIWLELLINMKAEPREPLKLNFTTQRAANSTRDKWYRFRKVVEANPELYELYKDVLKSRTARVEGSKLIFEYKEPLGIEDAIRNVLKEEMK